MARWIDKINRPIFHIGVSIVALRIGGVGDNRIGRDEPPYPRQIIPGLVIQQPKLPVLPLPRKVAVGQRLRRGGAVAAIWPVPRQRPRHHPPAARPQHRLICKTAVFPPKNVRYTEGHGLTRNFSPCPSACFRVQKRPFSPHLSHRTTDDRRRGEWGKTAVFLSVSQCTIRCGLILLHNGYRQRFISNKDINGCCIVE